MPLAIPRQPRPCECLSQALLTVGRHFRAGEITSEELERIVTIIQNPTQYKIPTWFLNRQRDIVDGKDSQVLANGMDSKLREDLERLKKIRAHRGLRHYWGLRVRGQHSKTTGRRGRTVGVSKKKG